MRAQLVAPRHTVQRRRARRSKVSLVELFVSVVIVCGLTGLSAALFGIHQKHAADAVAAADLHSAIVVLEACNAADSLFPVSGITLTGGVSTVPCADESLTASAGTTLTYVPIAGASSYVLMTTNSRGTGAAYCFDNSIGGSIRTVARGATTC